MTPDICLLKITTPLDDETVRFLMPFSLPEKQQRILRQRVKQNADAMLIGAVLARHMLWKRFSIPLDARIAYGKFGKPYLPDYPYAHFNISHSGPYVACAVCDVSIGIDIQKIVPYRSDVAIRVFEQIEIEQIESSSNPSAEFTKIWTQMESRVKMSGIGIGLKSICDLSPPYETFSCFIEDAFVSISYKARCKENF